MYYNLISAVKRRLILELQQAFTRHPVYGKIVPFIENKYSFKERPQFGIVVKGASSNKARLSSDNFLGTIDSRVMLANFRDPCFPIEWIREDLAVLRQTNDVMPTPAGVYLLEILTVPDAQQNSGSYVIDPLLTITDEPVLQFQSGIEKEAQLQNLPSPGTLRLWENRNYLLKEGRDYTVDYTNGAISLNSRFYTNSILTADYRYAAPSVGPIDFYWNTADFTTLPGVVMAFGKRARVGDKVAVVVYPERVSTAQAYGGRTDQTYELEIIAQDPIQCEEMADLVFMYLEAERKQALAKEGIELVDISLGGEAEEAWDETSEIFYYVISISVQFQTDWEVHIPLPVSISRATTTPASTDATVTPDRTVTGRSSLQMNTEGDLFYVPTPILVNRNNTFERIT